MASRIMGQKCASNPKHVEWLLEGVEPQSERRSESEFHLDHSDVDISSKLVEAGMIDSKGKTRH